MKQLPEWIKEEPEELRELLIALHRVRYKGVWGLRDNSAPIPELVDLASAHCPKSSSASQYELMTALLGDVLLPHLTQNQDHQAVKLYFGLLPETQTASPKTRREKTGSRVFHQSLPVFRRPDTGHERPFLVRLAKALVELRKTPPRAKTYRNYSTPYIVRPKYDDAFESLITKDNRLIAFEGEPGNGKTRLADELVAKRLGRRDTRIDLDAGSATVLMSQISGILSRYADGKVKTYPSDPDALIRAFAAFICSADAPAYLVVDNISDVQLLDRLVPPSARSLTVITSRDNTLPHGRGVSLTVEGMEDDEARQFAALLLPRMALHDIDHLINTLGNKPLAIDHACTGLLADGYMTVQEFCTAFQRHAAVVMKQAKSPGEESLSFIYEQVLSRLREQDAKDGTKTAILLELISFVAPEAIPEGLLRNALVAASPPTDASLAPVELQSAQRELRRLHLVRAMGDGLTVHQFTQAVLRDILRGVEIERCLSLHKVLREQFIDLQPGDALSTETMRLLQHTSSVLLGLRSIDQRRQADEGIEHTLRILAEGMLQAGYIGALTHFFKRFFSLDMPDELDLTNVEAVKRMVLEFIESGAINFADIFKKTYCSDGIISRFTYANKILSVAQGEHDGLTVDLHSPGVVKVLEAKMLRYEYDFVNTVLASDEMRRIEDYHEEEVAWRGDVLRLTADALVALGHFTSANTTWSQVVTATLALSSNSLSFSAGVLNLSVLRGRLFSRVATASSSA